MLETLLQVARPALAAAFTLWGSPVTWLELVAFVLALAMVFCNLRVHVAAWPLAIHASDKVLRSKLFLFCLVLRAARPAAAAPES